MWEDEKLYFAIHKLSRTNRVWLQRNFLTILSFLAAFSMCLWTMCKTFPSHIHTRNKIWKYVVPVFRMYTSKLIRVQTHNKTHVASRKQFFIIRNFVADRWQKFWNGRRKNSRALTETSLYISENFTRILYQSFLNK